MQQLSRLRLSQLESLTVTSDDYGSRLSVLDGLRHLMEIPSLTRLQLPCASADQVHHLRLLHRVSHPGGRCGISIDTAMVPRRTAGLFDV